MHLFASVLCHVSMGLELTLHCVGLYRTYLLTEPSPLLFNYLKPLSLSLQLSLSFPDASPQSSSDSSSFQRITRKNARQVNFDPIAVLDGGVAEVAIKFAPPPGCHWTEGAPSAWQVIPNSESTSIKTSTRKNA